MQLSRARTPLDSLFHATTPSTPQFIHAAVELCGYAPPVRDPLTGYPPLPQLPAAAAAAVSDPSSSSSGSFIFGGPDGSPTPPEFSSSSYSSLSFRYGCSPLLSGSSILSFDHGATQFEDYAAFADAFEHADGQINLKCSFDDTTGRSVGLKDGDFDDQQFGWIYSDAAAVRGTDPHGSIEAPTPQKRHRTGGEVQQPSKKHCGGSQKKAKSKPSASKDPQSIAAKNRRERISERLKILQDLVPNGTKVDLVTMLEKAISYVKFLQLQVKVLSTDELWPSQGGKAPEISQVRDVIDSILSSHRERTCSGL